MMNRRLTKFTRTSCWDPDFYITLKHIQGLYFLLSQGSAQGSAAIFSVPDMRWFRCHSVPFTGFYPDEGYI